MEVEGLWDLYLAFCLCVVPTVAPGYSRAKTTRLTVITERAGVMYESV